MLIDTSYKILQRITLLNRLEKACFLAAFIIFIITVCIFFRMKIYKCIYILSGKKAKNNIKKLQKKKNKKTISVSYLILFIGMILCDFIGVEGHIEKNLLSGQNQKQWVGIEKEVFIENGELVKDKNIRKMEREKVISEGMVFSEEHLGEIVQGSEKLEDNLPEDSVEEEKVPPEFRFLIQKIGVESEKYPNSIFYTTDCQAKITIKINDLNQVFEDKKLRLKIRKCVLDQTSLGGIESSVRNLNLEIDKIGNKIKSHEKSKEIKTSAGAYIPQSEKMKIDINKYVKWEEIEYGLEDFIKSEEKDNVYEMILPFTGKIGKELIYDVTLEYQDENGNYLVAQNEMEAEKLGTLVGGVFHSKEIVIDQRLPAMDREIMLEEGQEDSDGGIKNGEYYYDGKVTGSIFVSERFFDEGSVQVLAIPLNEIAKESARKNKNVNSQGEVSIKKWSCKQWEGDTENYKIEFDFQEEGKWIFSFSCKDIAGNEGIADGKEQEKISCSSTFIIDMIAPEIMVAYSKNAIVSDLQSSPENINKEIQRDLKEITSSKCEVFMEMGETQKIEITEENFNAQEVKLNIYKIDYSKREKDRTRLVTEEVYQGADAWKQESYRRYMLTICFKEEGHYQFVLEYEDPVGHLLTSNQHKETMVCLENGIYQSPMCTMDSKAPVIEKFVYETENSGKSGERIYFKNKPEIYVSVIEENFNKNDFYLEDTLFYANGKRIKPAFSEKEYAMEWESYYENGERINRAKIIIEEEANHTFYVNGCDGGLHEAQMIKEQMTYDKTDPEITYISNQNKKGDIQFQNVNFFGYDSFRYFSKNKIPVTVIAHDDISGVGEISYYFVDAQGNKIENSLEKGENRGKDVEKTDLAVYQVEAVVDVEEFKGFFCAKAEDYSGNQCDEISCKGMVSESEVFHEKTSAIHFELSEADYTDVKTKTKYYKSNAEISAMISDGQSGIHHIKMMANSKQNQNYTKEKAAIWRSSNYFENPNITYLKKEKINLSGEKFTDVCKENPIEVRVEYTDNAGNVSYQDYSDYKIVTDSIKPVISVKYQDSPDSQMVKKKYYNETREATVAVEDWNFNPASVKWQIGGSNKEYRITQWKGDGEYHWCKVIFYEDGEDYKIKLSVSDFAGNKAKWDGDRAFVIDKTKPVLSLQIDADYNKNSSVKANERYYNSSQTVLLKIREKNFRERDVKYEIEAQKDGKKIKLPALNSFHKVHAEQTYYNTILFKEDGDYKITFQYTDLAGNKAKLVEPLQFTIDQTKPEIKVSGVRKEDAYSGKVEPMVICTDRNIDEKSFACVIENSEGKKIGGKDFPVKKEQIKNGFEMKWKDFPYEEWADDVYTLKVIGKDLAGNSSTIKGGVVFSVNRFGSIFILQPQSEKLIKEKYINEEQDLCIREISVNHVDTEIIILKDNQERRQLKAIDEKNVLENQEESQKGSYTVSSNMLQKKLVNEEKRGVYFSKKDKRNKEKQGWQEKIYTINKENFDEEGVYQITLHSVAYNIKDGKKKIIKETDNITKSVPIQFTVDKKPPVVKISGLNQNAYMEKEHFFNVTVLDNYGLAYMDLNINYENGKKKKKTIRINLEQLGKMHGVSEKLDAYNGYQIVSYTARDLAGNEICSSDISDDKRCLITPNQIVQTYYVHPILYRIVGIMLFLVMVTICCSFSVIYKRLKRKEKK